MHRFSWFKLLLGLLNLNKFVIWLLYPAFEILHFKFLNFDLFVNFFDDLHIITNRWYEALFLKQVDKILTIRIAITTKFDLDFMF